MHHTTKSVLRPALCLGLTINGALFNGPVTADSSSPRLAAYYDLHLALCDGQVYQWEDNGQPQPVMSNVKQVGVGRDNRYALTHQGTLLQWQDDPARARTVMQEVKSFHAGRSGLLVIRNDASLWQVKAVGLLGFGEKISDQPLPVASGIGSASVGDGADYYVTLEGKLHVTGRAHRGQYGDGKLLESEDFVNTLNDVVQIAAHTGHALALKHDGSVWGTGGNIYGPLGRHGHGDKASRWGLITGDARAIATGHSHSLAIMQDDTLWIWGRNEGLEPRQVLQDVQAAAAGNDSTVAISAGWLWQWQTGTVPKKIMKCGNPSGAD